MQNFKQKTENTSNKKKLIFVLCCVVAFVCGMVATPLLILYTQNKNVDATTTRADATIGNLYNIDGSLNKVNAGKLLSKLKYSTDMGDKNGITGPKIATRAGTSGSFVFEMGYFVDQNGNMDTGKPLTWQAVYLRNGYLTIWLNNSYTTGYFNYSTTGSTISDHLVGFAGYTTSQYKFAYYYNSLIRDVVKGINAKIASRHTAWNAYIRSPMEMEAESGVSWQSSQPDPKFYNTSYTSKWNSMKSGSTYDITGDKMWIPSHYELFSTNTSSASTTSGFWGVNSATERKDNSTMAYDGTTIDKQYSWTRSATSYSGGDFYMVINANGTIDGDYSSHYYYEKFYGYRPACHLWLDYLATDIGYDTTYSITASVDSGSTSILSLDKTSGSFISVNNDGDPVTFKFTASTNYTVSKITINGVAITIGQAKQYDYLMGVGTEYKCFRSGQEVYVIVSRLWQNLTIVGYADYDFVVTPANADLTIANATCTTNGSTMNARVVIAYNWSKNIRFKLDGSEWVNLQGEMSQGTVGSVTYVHNSDYQYKFVMIDFSNLSVGTHSMEVDYYTASVPEVSSVTVNVNGGSATVTKKEDSDNNVSIVVVPATGYYVNTMTIEGMDYPIAYYKEEVYGAGTATTIQYVAKSQNNSFVILIENVYQDFAINLLLTNVAPTLKNPPLGGGTTITGSVVTATAGGEARIVGNDMSTDEGVNTVTYVAVAYTGYTFSHWVDIADENTPLSNSASMTLSREDAEGKIIKAVFVKTSNQNTNGEVDNSTDIL